MRRKKDCGSGAFIFVISVISLFSLFPRVKAQSNKRANSFYEEHENPHDREEYLFNMLCDTKTNTIPVITRGRELEYARSLNRQLQFLPHLASGEAFYNWSQTGHSLILRSPCFYKIIPILSIQRR